MESHTKYQETIYLRSSDESTLWINLFIPSTLDWRERSFKITQETRFPRTDESRIIVSGQGPLTINVRVPSWVSKGVSVRINGEDQTPSNLRSGEYFSLSRNWSDGDTIEIKMPFSIRIERARDRPDTQSIMWGPVVLQTIGKPRNGSYWELSLYKYLKRDGSYLSGAVKQIGQTANGDPLFTTFTSGNGTVDAQPYYVSDGQAVSTYFRRVEPYVIFGGINSGVSNRKRNDGLPSYDVPVSGISSPGTDGPTFLDLLWDQAPFATHNMFVDTVTAIADLFVAAKIYSLAERDTIVDKARLAEQELNVNS